jgi:P27 family predicted phage terminase small subunit
MTARLDPPQHFDEERRAIWQETVTRLTAGGRIFRADPEILGTYVEAVRSHRQASRILAETNVMVIRDGQARENPALAIQRRTAQDMARASKALGLDHLPVTPIAEAVSDSPIAPRWCDEHQRQECRHRRQDGSWCHQWRLVGGLDTCRKHGGKSLAQLREEGRNRILEAQARAELARLDVPPVTDPLTELAKVAAQAVAWKNAMGEKVNELTSLRYEASAGTGEQLRAEIALWERALDRCVATLTAMAKLNIEDRLAGVRKQTADMLERALDAALEASGTGLDGKQKAREAFRRQLKVVA